jgi:hypothetical protein
MSHRVEIDFSNIVIHHVVPVPGSDTSAAIVEIGESLSRRKCWGHRGGNGNRAKIASPFSANHSVVVNKVLEGVGHVKCLPGRIANYGKIRGCLLQVMLGGGRAIAQGIG